MMGDKSKPPQNSIIWVMQGEGAYESDEPTESDVEARVLMSFFGRDVMSNRGEIISAVIKKMKSVTATDDLIYNVADAANREVRRIRPINQNQGASLAVAHVIKKKENSPVEVKFATVGRCYVFLLDKDGNVLPAPSGSRNQIRNSTSTGYLGGYGFNAKALRPGIWQVDPKSGNKVVLSPTSNRSEVSEWFLQEQGKGKHRSSFKVDDGRGGLFPPRVGMLIAASVLLAVVAGLFFLSNSSRPNIPYVEVAHQVVSPLISPDNAAPTATADATIVPPETPNVQPALPSVEPEASVLSLSPEPADTSTGTTTHTATPADLPTETLTPVPTGTPTPTVVMLSPPQLGSIENPMTVGKDVKFSWFWSGQGELPSNHYFEVGTINENGFRGFFNACEPPEWISITSDDDGNFQVILRIPEERRHDTQWAVRIQECIESQPVADLTPVSSSPAAITIRLDEAKPQDHDRPDKVETPQPGDDSRTPLPWQGATPKPGGDSSE